MCGSERIDKGNEENEPFRGDKYLQERENVHVDTVVAYKLDGVATAFWMSMTINKHHAF